MKRLTQRCCSSFSNDLLGTFIVKRHEGLNGEKIDMEVLHMRNDMLVDNVSINSGAGSICLLKILNYSIVNYVTSLVDEFSIMFLSGADNDICQRFTELGRIVNGKRSVEPRSRTEISDMRLVTESGTACCFPSIITAFW